jgi:hypothetical protein
LESSHGQLDVTEPTAEIPRRSLGQYKREPTAANKFHWIVLKMREAQTFLATFKNDHPIHEDFGRYFDFGAAHDFGRSLYRPDADERAPGGPARELMLAVGAGVRAEPWGTTMLSVDQFLRLVSVPAVFLAFHIAAQISGS